MRLTYKKNKKPQLTDVLCATCKKKLSTDELLRGNLCIVCTIKMKNDYERKK